MIGCRLLVVGYRLSDIGCRLSVVGSFGWKPIPSAARVTRDEVSGLKQRRGELSGRQYLAGVCSSHFFYFLVLSSRQLFLLFFISRDFVPGYSRYARYWLPAKATYNLQPNTNTTNHYIFLFIDPQIRNLIGCSGTMPEKLQGSFSSTRSLYKRNVRRHKPPLPHKAA